MKKFKATIMMLGVAGGTLLAGGAFAAVSSLPFSAKFETNNLGDALSDPWASLIAPVVTNTPGSPDPASTKVAYSADEVNLEINDLDNYYSNVWWHSYAKVRPQTADLDPSDIDGAAAGFYVKDNGDLVAYSNNAWIVVAQSVPTDAWLGFSVELDYVNGRWNLYKSSNDYTHGDALELVNTGGPLAFNTAYAGAAGLTNVQVSGETYLDNMTLAKAYQDIPATATPTKKTVSGDSIELKISDALSGTLLTYFEEADRKLSGAFGAALGSMLETGEKISIYTPNEADVWQVFTYQGAGVWSQTLPASGGVGLDYIMTPTMGIYFTLNNDNPREAIFMAAFESTTDDAGTATVYGRDTAGGGWNLLALPMQDGTKNVINGVDDFLGLSPNVGDRMYFRRSGQLVRLTYFGGSIGWARYGTRSATESFPAGSGFWYFFNATSVTGTYTP